MATSLPLSDQEHDRVTAFIVEFSNAVLHAPVTQYDCIYRSHAFAESRAVLVLRSTAGSFALKIDTESPATGRLKDEFELLVDLSRYFERTDSSRVVQPVYLSPGGAFLVTEFIDRPTAVDLIYNSKDDNQVVQVYRRAGSWLSDFHSRLAPVNYGFRPKWMIDSICDLAAMVPDDIAQKSRKMIDAMVTDGERLKGIEDLRVFSHGDFHGQNLIIGQGKTHGLDFTEVCEKLAVYDIVDFLKADIFRDGPASAVDQSGILRRNKQMFLRRYRLPIDTDILDFCIRGRLLKDWLDYWRTDFTCSAFEKFRRTRLEMRLDIAFGTAN
ncbi:phosphotransferase [Ruegeria sp. HKCCA5491]|uniref:phosphotransferase n=1 Tax=Ruegeria sp. HKCCA5491 TaxID=2682986 RepID=UPI0014881418|nr:phosphotransferase [Ruegeria sp. HKCCA5491]